MLSLKSCWNYLRYATGDHVIVSLGADAYDILSMTPDSLGEYMSEKCAAQVVGIFSPGTDWATIAAAADALKTAGGENRGSEKAFASGWYWLKRTSTRNIARCFRFSARRHRDGEPE